MFPFKTLPGRQVLFYNFTETLVRKGFEEHSLLKGERPFLVSGQILQGAQKLPVKAEEDTVLVFQIRSASKIIQSSKACANPLFPSALHGVNASSLRQQVPQRLPI